MSFCLLDGGGEGEEEEPKFYLDKGTPMGINTNPLGGEGTQNNRSRHKINIQANIRQDKTPDIDFRDKPTKTPYGTYGNQREESSAISDLAGYGFEEEDYHVADYMMILQSTMSTTVR
uniref:Uncharacterized protein n=1 Tax=Oryza sativa subsp. japonica TaxID=39947 RepID=Q6Z8U2_ORYSJ|nr:hypothetical protein [Oryza sativa Japonica Group]